MNRTIFKGRQIPTHGYLPWVLKSLCILLAGCTTQEQIEQQKKITLMSDQMKEGHQITAKVYSRVQELEEKISALSGEMEDYKHSSTKEKEKKLKDLRERVELLENSQKAMKKKMTSIDKQLISQKKYLKEVLRELTKLSGKSFKKSSKKPTSLYNQAIWNYKKGRYKKAEAQFLSLIKNKSVKGNKKARLVHNLGMIRFISKDYKNALIYFSRLYNEHPKAPYNSNGLLYLGKTFQKLQKKQEARQSFQTLVDKYPGSKHAKEARKILKSL